MSSTIEVKIKTPISIASKDKGIKKTNNLPRIIIKKEKEETNLPLKILVDKKRNESSCAGKFMNKINEVCQELNNYTDYIPTNKNYNYTESYDIGFIFNGIKGQYKAAKKHLKDNNATIYFIEYGYLPHYKTFQISPTGINFFHYKKKDIDNITPSYDLNKRKGKNNKNKDVLFLLQNSKDSQITNSKLNPRRHNFEYLLRSLAKTDIKIRVRKHPRFTPTRAIYNIVKESNNIKFDTIKRLSESAEKSYATITINSSAGIELLKTDTTIINLGRSVFEAATLRADSVQDMISKIEQSRNGIVPSRAFKNEVFEKVLGLQVDIDNIEGIVKNILIEARQKKNRKL